MRAVIDIRDVPVEIRDAVIDDATGCGVSVNDAVGSVLAKHYGVEWEPSGYPFLDAERATGHWNLRIPETLRDAIQAHGRAIDGTLTGCVLFVLADHYGLTPVSPRRRSRRALDPATIEAARARHEDDGVSLRQLAREYGVTRRTVTHAIRSG